MRILNAALLFYLIAASMINAYRVIVRYHTIERTPLKKLIIQSAPFTSTSNSGFEIRACARATDWLIKMRLCFVLLFFSLFITTC